MPFQSTYGMLPIGYPGMRVGSNIHDADTYTNDTGMKRKVVDYAITLAGDESTYTIVVGGVTISYTSGVDETIEEVRDGLIANARATGSLDNVLLFNMNGDNVRVTSALLGSDFTATNGTGTVATVAQAYVAQTTIPFGRFVTKRPVASGGVDRSAGLPTATGQIIAGVVEREQHLVDTFNANVAGAGEGVRPGALMTVVRRGGMYVECTLAMAVGDPVYMIFSGADAGKIRPSAGGVADLIPNGACRVKRGAEAGGLVEILLNLP